MDTDALPESFQGKKKIVEMHESSVGSASLRQASAVADN